MKTFDDSFRIDGIKLIAGVDEAGRGPLAGPVVAASVIFSPDDFIEGVNDSKQLTETQREHYYSLIINKAVSYSASLISHTEIDEINILQATLKAMKEAVNQLNIKPDLILIDGNKIFSTTVNTQAIVKGDGKSFSIAAASIIAKVTRDRIMRKLDEDYPGYLWAKNKGYATKEHIRAIKKLGITPYHRISFLKNIIDEKVSIQFELI